MELQYLYHKINFKTKTLRDKEEHYIVIKGANDKKL